ncbi:Protein SUPPRESSOR OF K(+) TRANSPORT GROWTH DEFECT 1 [Seminavis robusta]|uniref:vesicle-fusing ATPase n=1 Tax=Seminavis robusta TaxID=568900 RepID=A0A9N8EMH2_9STRA|nr:Protein SUPPRESSOR OF K(+) TRANSPORT GROWTH DEFECT 1 [Seminavis robusta]|eukprot:Sro1177_g249420.1 Protein SUPPRESSOR OF K(+) TRANSPORT GROWTH DEFECT 1 (448) ;mRNA; r:22349-23779
MDNQLIPQAIEIVTKAIQADNDKEYEKALSLYRDALARFTLGLKYEKNEAKKKLVLERVEGYMQRAEELSDYLKKQSELDNKGGGGAATKAKDGTEEDEDAEKKKLRGALSGAIVSEKPNVKWTDVAGLENAKESLKETVILPTRFPQLFTGKRKPFKGILLYGPPGTGKSYLAKAVATEADSTFFSVSSADLISKWQGESERLVRNLFEMARESPGGRAIIFIDEVDSLCGSRSEGESDSARRVKTEFLVQMDGVGKQEGQVLVLGATNVPWELDAAIRRRFEKRVYIPLPEPEARAFMCKLHLGDTPNSLTEHDFDNLGEITLGASGSDIKVLVKEALMEPLRRCQQAKQFIVDKDGFYLPCENYPSCSSCPPKLSSDPADKDYTCTRCGAKRMQLWDVPPDKLKVPVVEYRDFAKVMRHSCSTVSEDELKRFVEWTKSFGQDGA